MGFEDTVVGAREEDRASRRGNGSESSRGGLGEEGVE